MLRSPQYVSPGIGENLGKGFAAIETAMLWVVAFVTLSAWSLLLSARTRPQRRALGLVLVLLVHLVPSVLTLLHARPADDWSLASTADEWGAPAAWALPGLLAALWAVPWFVAPRAVRRARGLAVAAYLALLATFAVLYRPPSLPEPLVEVVISPQGRSACGRTQAGDVYCMGANSDGQIEPPGDYHDHERPTRVAALSPASRVFLGERTTCARTDPSSVRCLGRRELARDQSWESHSTAEIADLVVDREGTLVAVSPGGDLEALSGPTPGPIAAATRAHAQCCDDLWYRAAAGSWVRSTLNTGRWETLAGATSVGCHRCMPAWISGAQLTVRTRHGDRTLAVPGDASIVADVPNLVLTTPAQHALCEVEDDALVCPWTPGGAPDRDELVRRALHGDAATLLRLHRDGP